MQLNRQTSLNQQFTFNNFLITKPAMTFLTQQGLSGKDLHRAALIHG